MYLSFSIHIIYGSRSSTAGVERIARAFDRKWCWP